MSRGYIPKLMVMYPCPHDIRAFETLYEDGDMSTRDGLSSEYAMSFEAFEKLYHEEHVPMIVKKLVGKTRFVATKIVATPDGTPPPFYRIAEIHFPSLEALQTCGQSAGGKETLAHADAISSGGAPTVLLAEGTNILIWQQSRLGPD